MDPPAAPPLDVGADTGRIEPLAPSRDAEAAAILAGCPSEGTAASGAAWLATLRDQPETDLFGLVVGGRLAAVAVLRRTGLAVELALLVVGDGYRGQGYGRRCLADALRRAGKRPLVVEADEATLGFYRAAGFKLVGKRPGPDGAIRYRLGWHAPRPVGGKDVR